MTPILFAYLGIAIMLIGCGVGSVYGISFCANAAVGALKKNPSGMGSYITLSALPSTQGLYGFVGYFLLSAYLTESVTIFQGLAIFGVGLILGVVGLLSAMRQGQICANGIAAIGNGYNVFGGTMVLAVFPELYAIISLLVVVLVSGTLG